MDAQQEAREQLTAIREWFDSSPRAEHFDDTFVVEMEEVAESKKPFAGGQIRAINNIYTRFQVWDI